MLSTIVQIIRESWGGQTKATIDGVVVRFVVARPASAQARELLVQESRHYGDILLVDSEEQWVN